MHKLVDSAEVESREMFIDVLNGLIVGGSVPPGEQACIVEDDPDICAYIFSLLCSIRDTAWPAVCTRCVRPAWCMRLPSSENRTAPTRWLCWRP
jgi:hypothetical protein